MSMNIGLTGLKAATTHIDVVSQNIANSSTTGFKSGRAEFGDIVDANAGKKTPGSGVRTQAVNQQFKQGSSTITDNALDLAINGNGFFAVKDSSGISYTRAGSFHVDKDGNIVNNLGQNLLGKDGQTPLKFGGTGGWHDISVDGNGNITAKDSTGADTPALQVGLTDFPNANGLKRVGDTQWIATPEAGTAVSDAPGSKGLGLVSSGELEASNVDISAELVDLIVAQRDFNANSKTITANKEMVQTVINM